MVNNDHPLQKKENQNHSIIVVYPNHSKNNNGDNLKGIITDNVWISSENSGKYNDDLIKFAESNHPNTIIIGNSDTSFKEINNALDVASLLENEEEATEFYVPKYTKNELLHDIGLLKKSSGCNSVLEYKQKIAKGEIINFSHAQIEMWEDLEEYLHELEEED